MRELKNQLRYVLPLWFVFLITSWFPDNRLTIRFRGFLASFFMKKCGKNFTIAKGVIINNPQGLVIGDHVYIAKGCWLNAMAGLTIEDEVIFAPYVVISTTQHVFDNNSVRFGGSIANPVLIGKGSWLASHVSVKCGVEVGKGNLIAANASVTKSTPDFKILGGVPARIIKDNVDTKPSFSSRAEFEKSIK
ncbi:acyltransferase [Salegentibacter maritimus]|uniref:Acyltransferase n=1 Tax=Salegentibacter maritimus TaxID=2794347 RepID=A0ABS0TES6_9FLAO|nr:acyltransferase [Salegentibacter maritimus]MBI6115945.1 acyltransferase [Salegentibacter maritimus]MBI6119540.1 acyltransferase [Salegentibacter maritimus]